MEHLLGLIIGALFMLVWVPYASYQVGRTIGSFLVPTPDRKPRPQKAPPRVNDTKPKKTAPKPSKTKYQVIDTYHEEHRIINPIDFNP